MPIPRIVHYIWVGPNPLPAQAQEIIADWKVLLPGWEFMLWDESNIDFSPLFLRQASGARAYNRVSNYVRTAALHEYGGFYMDHDFRLLKSLEPLREHDGVMGFQTSRREDSDLVNTAFIGAVPNHPFIARVRTTLDTMDGGFNWMSGTGPGLFTRLLRESDAIEPQPEPYVANGMTLFPPRYFYPYPFDGAFTPECVVPDTYGVHLWDHSWKGRPGLLGKVEKKLRHLMTRAAPDAMSSHVRRQDWRRKAAALASRAATPQPA